MNQQGRMITLIACAVLAAGAAGLYNSLAAGAASPHQTNDSLVQVSPGYTARQVADQFTTPVGVAVSDRGDVYIAESGQTGGTTPRVIKLTPGKARATLAADFPAPLTGLSWHGGKLYVSYAGGVDVLDPATGVHHPVLSKLPAVGDYANGAVTFAPDGTLYFGIGTATNSGVIGQDNIQRGWVAKNPDFHDIPCKPVKVWGKNFSIANPLTPDPYDIGTTGAFSAFGKTTGRLQILPGAVPCTGAVLRANPDGTGLSLVSWGLRNPAGLAFGPDGQLYTTNQGYEERGSRPIVGDKDYLYKIVPGAWYGWPDFAGIRSVTSEPYQKPGFPATPLLAELPGRPPNPVTTFAHGAGAAGLLFPPAAFGLGADALVALSGPWAPTADSNSPPGGLLVRVNLTTGQTQPFLSQSPSAALTLARPIALAATARGQVYLVDFGQTRPGAGGLEPVPGTGRLWVIERKP